MSAATDTRPTDTHDRADHAYWSALCTCGLAEQERTGHYPEHAPWCEVPSPLDDDEPAPTAVDTAIALAAAERRLQAVRTYAETLAERGLLAGIAADLRTILDGPDADTDPAGRA